ncbi:aconitate hydratase AcnA [Candidimonas nitroreducens]|uniref:Aconitate hydratase n=1 Tax=Candidimonas nitroreducens TaxID=683354 RepID=A0A225MM22_9BURK|nr:aconitate hydratase AcnA [Candidimonas nitroreducens]OWT60561.1 aconitate hydratase 1 [Candidimonas nitroreducens]
MPNNTFNSLQKFKVGRKTAQFHSLPALGRSLGIDMKHLPVSLRIVLESVLRNCDGSKITEQHVRELAGWQPNAKRTAEIPFVVARVVLQDFTGVPLLADVAAMRSVADRMGKDPKRIEPLVPVDLVVDHSVMIDFFGTRKALGLNMQAEFHRNRERYQFLKWGMQAFDTFGVVPPGVGIVHQVNLEYLARGVHYDAKNKLYYPDTLVGTDSHTTMINGIGVVGWGVGGIEAEAGMLGQPVYILTPDVVGVELKGELRGGVTATDLVLTITEMLRKEKVVGSFVEFCGPGTSSLSVTDRATIGNMAPEYGATMGFFPVDDRTIEYFKGTGRSNEEIEALKAYFKAQEMYGIPRASDITYTKLLTLDLSTVTPSLAGPKRPQDRIELGKVKDTFADLYSRKTADNGFNQPAENLGKTYTTSAGTEIHNGDIVIAAITSCTNTSNPSVMLAAGLLAKKAVEAGLKVPKRIKTSLAPGSRVVTEYLTKTGLLPYLEKLGFDVAAYGCTTCIGNAGDLTPDMNQAINDDNLVCAAVLSGNRNFEARIHPNVKANFLASPPLVVAYALAGTMLRDLMTEPVGKGKKGDVWLGDIWPSNAEVQALLGQAMDPEAFRANYSQIKANPGKLWQQVPGVQGNVYDWPESTYIAEPPFFTDFGMQPTPMPQVRGARVLAIFGDSVTTDHISPAGSIKESSPAGVWLKQHGVAKQDFNSYGSRRGNHEVMMRGTFANVRIKNLMIPANPDGSRFEGGETLHQPDGARMSIYDAAMKYVADGVPTVVFGGEEYGTGSSRDWAAKGTQLLGVQAVIARSFERIHRSNLVGMGVLPLQFKGQDSAASLGITGEETFDISGTENGITPQQDVTLTIHRKDGSTQEVSMLLRIDTATEVDYYQNGGILPYVLRDLLAA